MTQFLTKFKRIYVCDMLENCFPLGYIFFGAFWFLVLGLVSIALQIAAMTVFAPYYDVASGIWVGIYFLFVSLVMFYLSKLFGTIFFLLSFIRPKVASLYIYMYSNSASLSRAHIRLLSTCSACWSARSAS